MKLFLADDGDYIGVFTEEFILSDKFEDMVSKRYNDPEIEFSHWMVDGKYVGSMPSDNIPYSHLSIEYNWGDGAIDIELTEVKLNQQLE